MTSKLNSIFFGSPDFALPSLEKLIETGRTPLLVVTQTDKVRGRGKKTSPTPVKELALAHQIPVITPENVNEPSILAQLEACQPDLFLTAAYGQIFRKAFLELPRLSTLNVHASLLPKYRGSAPYQWAIVNGEKETGITIIEVVRKLDAGPILKKEAFDIFPEESAESLYQRLAELGGKLLLETVIDFEQEAVKKSEQNESEATLFGRLTKEDGLIDWNKSAVEICNFIRGMQPWPKAQTQLLTPSPKNIILLHSKVATEAVATEAVVTREYTPGEILRFDKTGIIIACGSCEAIEVTSLQVSGKKAMDAKAFVNGNHWEIGQRLGTLGSGS